MRTVPAFAGFSADTPLRSHQIVRRDPGPADVAIDILFCGVCHSDLHTVRGEWSGTTYPCVPGHEIVGRVTRVGANVTTLKAGDMAAVGCFVDSCRECGSCGAGLEQYCERKTVWTYNSPDPHLGGVTYGGYSTGIVVDAAYVLRVPTSLDPAAAAPLLCAGITMWSPLRHWGAAPGVRVGIVGLGGLGHMGLKLAHSLGAHVTLFTTSPGKAADAKRLGADAVVISREESAMKQAAMSLDLIVNTVAAAHDLDPFLNCLARDGTMVLVGIPAAPHPAITTGKLRNRRRALAGSSVGGIRETQEMLDFCAEHGIVSDVEMIRMDQVNVAYERMLRSDVKYRFVIDMESLKG